MKEILKLKAHMNEMAVMIEQLINEDSKEPHRVTMQKATLAERYDLSKSQIDKFMAAGIFVEEKHYCRPNGGYPMFYVEACDEVMRPKLMKAS